MKKTTYIILILFFMASLIAQDGFLNIDAQHFEANKQKNILFFKGNVKMIKNQDKLECELLIINTIPSKTDPNKQIPKDYNATGSVKFTIHTNTSILKGEGDNVYYNPQKQLYIIKGNGKLEDTKNGKKIIADVINVDEKTGYTKLDGAINKPIQFSLKLNDTNTTNTQDTQKLKNQDANQTNQNIITDTNTTDINTTKGNQ